MEHKPFPEVWVGISKTDQNMHAFPCRPNNFVMPSFEWCDRYVPSSLSLTPDDRIRELEHYETSLRTRVSELEEDLKFFEDACGMIVRRNTHFLTGSDANIACNATTLVEILREQRETAKRLKDETPKEPA